MLQNISCDAIKSGWGDDKARNAFYALKMISNWQSYQERLQADTKAAIDAVSSKVSGIVNDFLDAGKTNPHLHSGEMARRRLIHIVQDVFLTASSGMAYNSPTDQTSDTTSSDTASSNTTSSDDTFSDDTFSDDTFSLVARAVDDQDFLQAVKHTSNVTSLLDDYNRHLAVVYSHSEGWLT